MIMGILKKIEDEQQRRTVNFRSGDSVKVHVRIKEGDKERIQVYEGVVISYAEAVTGHLSPSGRSRTAWVWSVCFRCTLPASKRSKS